MPEPLFSILLPLVRPPALLPFAVASVLGQVEQRFELLIVCDGAPPETVSAARAFAASDSRIQVLDFPKGERHGEAHRHTALMGARGRYVCQIADDDVWLPNHLVEMSVLLESVEFGNVAHVRVEVDGSMYSNFGDLDAAEMRQRMLTQKFNLFGPTAVGYRLETYRALPVGWSPAPEDLWTDLAMWRKFLAAPGLKVGTRHVITALHFGAGPRADWSMDQRREEIAAYVALAKTEAGRDEIRQRVVKGVAERLWRSRARESLLAFEAGLLRRRLAASEAENERIKADASMAERPEGV